MNFDEYDLTPRYAPESVLIARGRKYGNSPVIRYVVHPPGQAPRSCPINPEFTVLELQTEFGSRWYGCKSAYINSELRMVVVGTHPRDEVRTKWQVCREEFNAHS